MSQLLGARLAIPPTVRASGSLRGIQKGSTGTRKNHLVSMAPGERPRIGGLWALGVFALAMAYSVRRAEAFCSASSFRSDLRPRYHQLGDHHAKGLGLGVALGEVTPGRRRESALYMVQKVRKKKAMRRNSNSVRRQRGGPRTDAEGYTAEAFGEWVPRSSSCSVLVALRRKTSSVCYDMSYALFLSVLWRFGCFENNAANLQQRRSSERPSQKHFILYTEHHHRITTLNRIHL